MSQKRIDLATTLLSHLERLSPGGTEISTNALPDLPLRPRDFLRYANLALQREDDEVAGLLEALTNLKRAMDSQVFTVLHAFNLQWEEKLKNSMPAKLDFLERCGFYSGSGLKKLNHIRNKIEHEYQIPSVTDEELYRDLVAAFVQACEGVVIFAQHREIELVVSSDSELEVTATSVQELVEQKMDRQGSLPEGVTVRYEYENRQIVFWGHLDGQHFEYSATPENWKDFEFFLRAMYGFYEYVMLGDKMSLLERLAPAELVRRERE